MNAHRQIIIPNNGFLTIEIPEDMKQIQAFEVFVVEATKTAIPKKKSKSDLVKLAGKYKNLSNREELQQQLDDLRNEWERPIF